MDWSLRETLEPVYPGRRFPAALLHLRQQRIGIDAGGERRGEKVRGGNRILHREVDSYPADRRHRLRGVADREIGRAHVCTPVTNRPLVCRLLLEKKTRITSSYTKIKQNTQTKRYRN